jgi:hypothetical protein
MAKGICPVCQQAHPLSTTSPGNHLEVHFCHGEQCEGSGHVAQAIVEQAQKIPKATLPPLRRVLVNSDGETVAPARAESEFGIKPDTIFIRDDGWTLGCIENHEPVAARLWEKNWVEVVIYVGTDKEERMPFSKFIPMRGDGKPVD